MRKLFAVAAAILMPLIFASASLAVITEFSADIEECEDGVVTKNKVWIANDRFRRENADKSEIIVTRIDQRLTWFIYPKLRCFVETKSLGTYADMDVYPAVEKAGDLSRKFIGIEERDSYRLKKYEVTVKYGSMGEDKYYEYRRDDFPIPVRTESLDCKNYTEYKNISRVSVDRTLFNAPSNRYRKVTLEELDRLQAKYDEKQQAKQKKIDDRKERRVQKKEKNKRKESEGKK